MHNRKSTFNLKSTSAEFTERRKNIFDQLNVLERENRRRRNSDGDDQMDLDDEPVVARRSPRSETKHFRGKESIFKKPNDASFRQFLRKLPDFQKNPHKWTKYSLEDVKDITDKSNTSAAMSFLTQLKNRKNCEKNEQEDGTGEKIVFRKQLGKELRNDGDGEKKVVQKGSKIVMPEYIVGQKVKKEKNKRNKAVKEHTSNKQLRLDHLTEDDEIE